VLRSSGPFGWPSVRLPPERGQLERKGSQVDFVRAGFAFRTAEVLAADNLRS
jgi:hypothetical protein